MNSPTRPIQSDSSPVSQSIGPYKLLQQIGEGGMGSVWMAEQEKPVRRRVALKLIKAELTTKEVIARFEAERQALAMMDHQNIAKVLDAGTTDSGSPYFVMELVKGIPLTRYCDENKLSIKQRLKLFVPVCKAVQHAHLKGIIHRDLKPSNVLVTLYDGEPVPKVIDFGLAKAMEHTQKLTDKTMFTEYGKIVGTIQYMSPEQSEMSALDVDSRTDVYSLGVMLYELLTGSTPVDKDTLGRKTLLQILELIREKEPQRPSNRLSSSGDAVTGISKQRKITPARLQQILRGDLDWIVMKALEKDRTRRYETANGFAMDIERYLNDEPIVARPPSAGYRLGKFVRKNRGLVYSIAAITSLLLAGMVFGFYGRSVQEQLKNEAIEARKSADDQRQIILDAFEQLDPDEGGNNRIPVNYMEYVVDRASELDNPLDQADFLYSIGRVLRSGGLEAKSMDALETAYQIRSDLLGKKDKTTNESLIEYAIARIGWAGAQGINREMRDQSLIDHFEESLRLMTIAYENQADLDQSRQDYLTAQHKFGVAHLMVFKGLKRLKEPKQDYIAKAIEILTSVWEERKRLLGQDHLDTLKTLYNLANAHLKNKETDRAIQLCEQAVDGFNKNRSNLSDEMELRQIDNYLSKTKDMIGQAHHELKNHQEAINYYEKALAEKEAGYGIGHVLWFNTFEGLADCLAETRQIEKLINLFETKRSEFEYSDSNFKKTKVLRELDELRDRITKQHELDLSGEQHNEGVDIK